MLRIPKKNPRIIMRAGLSFTWHRDRQSEKKKEKKNQDITTWSRYELWYRYLKRPHGADIFGS